MAFLAHEAEHRPARAGRKAAGTANRPAQLTLDGTRFLIELQKCVLSFAGFAPMRKRQSALCREKKRAMVSAAMPMSGGSS